MTISQLIIGWFYYGIIFMGLSIMATVIINKVATRYFTAPLLINALGVLMFAVLIYFRQLTVDQFLSNLLFIYMPIVAASACFNGILWLVRRGRPLKNNDGSITDDKNE